MPRDGLFGNLSRIDLAIARLFRDATHGVDQLGASAVAQREREGGAGVLRERFTGGLELVTYKLGQATSLTNGLQLHVIVVHLALL